LHSITSAVSSNKLVLDGELRIDDARDVWEKLAGTRPSDGAVAVDLSRASFVDGAIVSLLVDWRARQAQGGVRAEILGGSERIRTLLHLYGADAPPERLPEAPRRENPIERVGALTERAAASLERAVCFVGSVTAAAGSLVRSPHAFGWRSVASLTARAGADGVPIVLLLNFLVGFVMAFQSSRQLQLYGANVYVADVVGISVTRELAPLMTAIIMSGRSGASYAAELGTMSVSQEIDALRTLGFAPTPYLVLPRVVALSRAAPVLTLLGDVLGVLGGRRIEPGRERARLSRRASHGRLRR
jgi:phospholipid/cholesterol/gamma-HCH transport system permease protein